MLVVAVEKVDLLLHKKLIQKRFAYLQVAGFLARFKYYAAWKIAESACIVSGLGFNGFDQYRDPKWLDR